MPQANITQGQIQDIIESIEELDYIKYGRNTKDHDEIVKILKEAK